MVMYILRILGFLLCVCALIVWGTWEFLFGDLREFRASLKPSLTEVKEGFSLVLRGESFL